MATWWNDYANNVLQGQSLFVDNTGVGTEVFGAGVDMRASQEGLHAQLETGAVTDGTLDIRLQESLDDGASDPYTDIVDFITGGIAAFAQILAADDNVSRSLNFKRSKRFVRAVALGVGGSTGAQFSVSIHGMLRRVL